MTIFRVAAVCIVVEAVLVLGLRLSGTVWAIPYAFACSAAILTVLRVTR